MAYDRYDTRQGPRDDRSRWSDDRSRWSDGRYDRERGQSGREERGFFDRAGDKIASWFGDEDDDDRGRREPMGGRDSRYEPGHGFGRDRERGRFIDDRDEDRGFRGGEWRDRGYRPMTGDYGRSEGLFAGGGSGRGRFDRLEGNWDRDEYRRTSFAGSSDRSQPLDPHYHEWRQRQIAELDRDYDEYRREHQSKFENDFGSWRQQRQTKRQMLGEVREHMEVVSSDDEHIGTVDRVAGDRLILAKSDPESGGVHHSLSCTEIDRIDGDRVILGINAVEARIRWRDESRERALFEREDQGEAGPHALDRSFSGTYR